MTTERIGTTSDQVNKPLNAKFKPGCRKAGSAWIFVALALTLVASVLDGGLAAQAPVAQAAEHQRHEEIQSLLKEHADVNTPQPDGMTALHWAAFRDDAGLAKILLNAKADVSVTNRYGVTPLALACQNGNSAIVEMLLAHGADANKTLRGGETALMTAARTGKPGPVSALLQHGANVNTRERRGQTALMWAAAEGHVEVVNLLLKAGADIQATLTDSGFTPLFFAAREGRIEVVRALLKAGVDVNQVMDPRRPAGKGPAKGSCALTLAIENGHYELALALLDAGANPNDQRSGFTPLHMMTWVRKPPRGEELGAPPPAELGRVTSLEFVKALVKRGADVNARLANGRGGPAQFHRKGATPFLMAAATDDAPLLRLLLELGADPNIANADNTTPLIAACGLVTGSDAANEVAGEEPEVLETIALLLKLGSDVNAVDVHGETAMHSAAYKNLPLVVKFLADHGAKIEIWNRKNRHGWTPLMIAQGFRPGNFKPSFETIEAIQKVMLAAGVNPPPPPNVVLNNTDYVPRPDSAAAPAKKQP